MLGIAVTGKKNEPTYILLYYTKSIREGNDDCPEDNSCYLGIINWLTDCMGMSS